MTGTKVKKHALVHARTHARKRAHAKNTKKARTITRKRNEYIMRQEPRKLDNFVKQKNISMTLFYDLAF